MSIAETVQDNVNSRTVQLVKLLTEVGPDIPEISRRLGQFKESVRYRYKEKVISRGFSVQAAANFESFGLRRMVMLVDFADPYSNYAQAIFSAMNELCYLVSFSKQLIGPGYMVMLSVPFGREDEVESFFAGLKEKGLFTSVEVLRFDWYRIAPMKAEFYDFDTGRWDFQLREPSTDFQAATYTPTERAKFDYTDLLIVKELQMDANKSLKEISDKLEINYKKLAWHYTAHVKARNLVRGYMINWMGTRYDYALEKALHRKHRYFAIDLIARDVNEYETMTIRKKLDAIPFVFAESAGKNYFARMFIPVDFVVEGLQYLGDVAKLIKNKISLYPLDQTDALTFTISYQLFDQVRKDWAFSRLELTRRFEELIVEIKERN
jgi:hypothetical protein